MNMKAVEDFDLAGVINITVQLERPSNLVWKEAQPQVLDRWGRVKQRAKPEGWHDGWSLVETRDLDHWYIHRPGPDGEPGQVVYRASAKVHLGHGLTVSRGFDSDRECMEWVDGVWERSGKRFERIMYP